MLNVHLGFIGAQVGTAYVKWNDENHPVEKHYRTTRPMSTKRDMQDPLFDGHAPRGLGMACFSRHIAAIVTSTCQNQGNGSYIDDLRGGENYCAMDPDPGKPGETSRRFAAATLSVVRRIGAYRHRVKYVLDIKGGAKHARG